MPTKYIHFTDEQKEQARQTDLCELLRSQGESSNDPARNMNGRTDRRRSPFGETFGFISTISRAATPLTSSEGSITRTIPRQ